MQPDTDSKYHANSNDITDNTIDFVGSVTAIVKEVGEVLQNVPYVKGLSGIILQFIKIREEIKSNQKRCREIIDKVLRISKSIYERLAEVSRSNGTGKLSRLEDHLGECERTLTTVYDALEKYRSRHAFSKFINRGSDELNELDRRVDELNIKLIVDILVDIKLQQASATNVDHLASSLSLLTGPDHVLPPKPPLLVQRDAQINSMLNILLSLEPSRIVILGGGGFGKTTLARSILHNPQISSHYKARYFLSCESMTNADAFLSGLGNMLRISAAPSNILASVRRILMLSTTLLCLDNFETPWEHSGTRTEVEELLASVADIPNLSLIVTMRGEQRPAKVAWSYPLLPPLSTLSLGSARSILHSIASDHTVDEFSLQLLEAVEGIPLAITLISNLLRDGETSESLWKQWAKEQTRVVENGGDDRESNLNTSISLSVYSPRMKKDPDATRLFVALSLLPDGFSVDAIEILEKYLGIPNIYRPLKTLRAVALARAEEDSQSQRVKILSPIRSFCSLFFPSEISVALGNVIDYYIDFLSLTGTVLHNSSQVAQVIPEINNIHSVFCRGYTTTFTRDIDKLIEATCSLSNWSRYIGYTGRDALQMALSRSAHLPSLHADCLIALGELYRWDGQLERAESCYAEATDCYKSENNVTGEAMALKSLGSLFIKVKRFDQAEIALRNSLKLYIQENQRVGEANVRKNFGRVYLAKGLYSEAEASFTTALDIYKQIPDLLGQANTYNNLADLRIQLDDLDKAEELAGLALDISHRANFVVGEGNALNKLGYLYLRTDRIAEGRRTLEQAYSLFRQIKAPMSELTAANLLGRTYIQQDQLAAAQACLTTSAKVALDVLQIPIALATLGWGYIQGNQLAEAEAVVEEAQMLFQKFADRRGQAEVLALLGRIYLKSNRLDEAEKVLKSAQGCRTYWDIEMYRLWTLGDLYIQIRQLEDAESSLNSALAFAELYRCSYQQGNVLRSMGSLAMKRGQVDQAVHAFRKAIEFHQKAQWVSEQATDMKRLGEAYQLVGNWKKAEEVFKEAERVMKSNHEF